MVDALLISVRGVRASLSWMAVEADTGTVGRFPEKERLRECYLHFLCRQSGSSPDRGSEPLRGLGEI